MCIKISFQNGHSGSVPKFDLFACYQFLLCTSLFTYLSFLKKYSLLTSSKYDIKQSTNLLIEWLIVILTKQPTSWYSYIIPLDKIIVSHVGDKSPSVLFKQKFNYHICKAFKASLSWKHNIIFFKNIFNIILWFLRKSSKWLVSSICPPKA
jgi:hypothetical protein